ncbi:MAG: mandelate racemase/muconate lactonizing enzyme family protein [Burkholderiaceae bacterium]
MSSQDLTLAPVGVQVHVFRYPVSTPVRTSFGSLHHRPAVFVRVEDASGAHGWGEVWCNFPPGGDRHRAQLVEAVLAPLLVGTRFESPRAAFDRLCAATAVLAIQSGEPGPFAHAIAGVDLALWDLLARRHGEPLWRFLGGTTDEIGVYASGINPDGVRETVAGARAAGYRAFKLKIGFDPDRDIENLREATAAAGDGATVMVDANQAWDLSQAQAMVDRLAAFDIGWIEEPLRADRPWSEWQSLEPHARAPLAAGENVAGEAGFEALLRAGAVGIVQPDFAKWGGISAGMPLVRRILDADRRFYPHYLGGGIGLLHSGHLLAASGAAGLLEVDFNDNALRTLACGRIASVENGRVRLGDAPGIGIEPDLQRLRAACPG